MSVADRRMTDLPLSDLRVLDLTMWAAGPFTTRTLADWGAMVIKIEGPVHYDPMRGSLRETDGDGRIRRPYNKTATFNEWNRNKHGITLDLSRSEGAAIFKRLAKISDVVVENFSPRVMKNFGLDYPALKEIKPDIIMVSLSAFGRSGPYRDYISYGSGIDAMSGLAHLTGYRDGPPIKPGQFYGDPSAALNAAIAVMMALHYRVRTGKGQYIDAAMLEGYSPLIGEALMDYAMNGRIQTRIGNRHPSLAPHGCYRCKGEDRWITIAIGSDDEWHRFCRAIGNPTWSQDKRFANVLGRSHNQDELDQLIEEWTEQHEDYEAMHILQQAGVSAGAVLNVRDVISDPHFVARGYFEMSNHPEAGEAPFAGVAYHFSKTPNQIRMSAPCYGEHNNHILSELLGMPQAEIAELAEKQVIASVPLQYKGEI